MPCTLDRETRAFLEAPLDGFTDYMADAISEPLDELFGSSDAYLRYAESQMLEFTCSEGHVWISHVIMQWPTIATYFLVDELAVSPVHAEPAELERVVFDHIGALLHFDGDFRGVLDQLVVYWSFLGTLFDRPNIRASHAHLQALARRFTVREVVFSDYGCHACEVAAWDARRAAAAPPTAREIRKKRRRTRTRLKRRSPRSGRA